jgi:hypothetical protein
VFHILDNGAFVVFKRKIFIRNFVSIFKRLPCNSKCLSTELPKVSRTTTNQLNWFVSVAGKPFWLIETMPVSAVPVAGLNPG